MTPTLKCGAWFAGVGFAIAIFLTWLAYYQNSHNVYYGLDGVYLLLFPPSVGLMATENAGVVGQVVTVAFVSLLNAALYGVIGLGVGKLRAKMKALPPGISSR